jgi:hypothetical protein
MNGRDLGGRIRDKLCKWRLLWGRKTPPAAAWGWLVGCAAPPMEREKSAAVVESM